MAITTTILCSKQYLLN